MSPEDYCELLYPIDQPEVENDYYDTYDYYSILTQLY